MTAIPETYSDAIADMTTITQQMQTAKNRLVRGIELLQDGVSILDSLDEPAPTGYAQTVQFINQQAAANPNDPAWQDVKAQKDKVVADFQSELTRAQSVLDAAQGAM